MEVTITENIPEDQRSETERNNNEPEEKVEDLFNFGIKNRDKNNLVVIFAWIIRDVLETY